MYIMYILLYFTKINIHVLSATSHLRYSADNSTGSFFHAPPICHILFINPVSEEIYAKALKRLLKYWREAYKGFLPITESIRDSLPNTKS